MTEYLGTPQLHIIRSYAFHMQQRDCEIVDSCAFTTWPKKSKPLSLIIINLKPAVYL